MDKTKNYYTEEESYWCTGGNTGLLPSRVTPSAVNVLADNEIFVFGSNFEGRHIGGAAHAAHEKFGAVWGIGEGLQGKSYAIPTMDGLDQIKAPVDRFFSFAKQHHELKFFVTRIGCGIAGYTDEQIAPLFIDAAFLPNVYLPLSFWKIVKDIPNSDEYAIKAANHVIELFSICRKTNFKGIWTSSIERAVFDALDNSAKWQLGIQLGVIPASEPEPGTWGLPIYLLDVIWDKLQEL